MRACLVVLCAATLGLSALAPSAGAQAPVGVSDSGRVAAERRVADEVADLVRRRLVLTDAQMQELAVANRSFVPRRSELLRREREVRRSIRRAIVTGDTTPDGPLATLLDTLLLVQRRRLDLVAEEQRTLARFLSPVQRVRYLQLQEQLRERIDRMPRGPGGRRPGGRGGSAR